MQNAKKCEIRFWPFWQLVVPTPSRRARAPSWATRVADRSWTTELRGGSRDGGLEFGALLAHGAAAGAARCAQRAARRSDALDGHTNNVDISAREHQRRLGGSELLATRPNGC